MIDKYFYVYLLDTKVVEVAVSVERPGANPLANRSFIFDMNILKSKSKMLKATEDIKEDARGVIINAINMFF